MIKCSKLTAKNVVAVIIAQRLVLKKLFHILNTLLKSIQKSVNSVALASTFAQLEQYKSYEKSN